MSKRQRPSPGLALGFASLALVTIGFLVAFLVFPKTEAPTAEMPTEQTRVMLLDQLPDPHTRAAVEALRAIAPGTFAELETVAAFAQQDGASRDALAHLLLEALFSQFTEQAPALRSATSADYQRIISGLSDGLVQLQANENPWCDGSTIAAFLAQNDQDLVPSLLAEFPYDSPQYIWAMDWMSTVLNVAKQARDRPLRHARPGSRDETVLQQEGLALGSEQWALALQIAAFANSEGTSYGKMQQVIASMDVCDLGMAVETVSERLPSDVRARIWADLLPELMVGNTPYVMWRVTDYFFIG